MLMISLNDVIFLACEWLLFIVTDVKGKIHDWFLYSINTCVNPLREHSGFGLHTGYFSWTNNPLEYFGYFGLFWTTCNLDMIERLQ